MSKESGGVEAVNRALKILLSFEHGDLPLPLAELAHRTGLYKSTLLRLLSSLQEGGLITRLPDKSYGVGPQALRLASIYQRMYRLEHHVRPVLKRLVEQTGESAAFNRREGHQRICLFRENSEHDLRDHVLEGDMAPITKGSAGHVLIKFAGVSADAIPPRLAAALPIYSFQKRKGICGCAAPVFASDGSLAGALTLSGPLSRLTKERLVRWSPLVLRAAEDVSCALGAPVPKRK